MLDLTVIITRSCSVQLERRMRITDRTRFHQRGAAGWILLWLLGIPIPVLLVLFLLRGCT